MASPCIVVASGQSAKGFVPPDNIPVIAVNGVIDWIERADYWFTLDMSEANIKRMERRFQNPGTEYHAAVKIGKSVPVGVRKWRRVARRDKKIPPHGTPEWWLWRLSGVKGINRNEGQINTGNSAWGALQLAVHLGFDRIMLLGVDADRNSRVEGGYPNNLCHLPLLFDSAVGEVDFINCGKMVSNVPKMSIEDGLKWVNG